MRKPELPLAAALAIFAGLGLGLALPFLLLAYIPALRSRLPRPGAWMGRFQKLLSVPMFLTALGLAWLLGQQRGVSGMTIGLGAALLLALLLWWLGARQHGGKGGGLIAGIGALALLAGAAIALPSAAPVRAENNATSVAFAVEKLDGLRAANKPVFLYFTADWCLTCKANEAAAIDRAEVRAAFDKAGVTVMVGDWTSADPAITRFLESQGRLLLPAAAAADARHAYRAGALMAKVRADQLLVDAGLAESRARAQALILAGLVYLGDRKVEKAGQQVPADAALDLRGRDHPWVSRGGIKLAHALEAFAIDVTGFVTMDVGSSTGGFTDVLLTHGAAKVYAVDSGTNQLAWKLRSDDRVIVHEQTSARILTDAHIPEPVDIIVCDASFISLAKVLEKPIGFARTGAHLVALIKPQFEARREEVGKNGVVRDPAIHDRVCMEVQDWVAAQGWTVAGLTQSPITGPQGNIEFLLHARLGG